MLELSDRVLLDTGVSVITSEKAAEILLRRGILPRHFSVTEDRHSLLYEKKYQLSVIGDSKDDGVGPGYIYTREEQIEVLDYIRTQRRDDTTDEAHYHRLDIELAFFVNTDSVPVLISLKELVDKFKVDGVVWGVGRGSSCASYALYLLEIHDINPIRYDIPFKEFSKVDQQEGVK